MHRCTSALILIPPPVSDTEGGSNGLVHEVHLVHQVHGMHSCIALPAPPFLHFCTGSIAPHFLFPRSLTPWEVRNKTVIMELETPQFITTALLIVARTLKNSIDTP